MNFLIFFPENSGCSLSLTVSRITNGNGKVKGATKSYLMHYSSVVIILFKRVYVVFRLSVLSVFLFLSFCFKLNVLIKTLTYVLLLFKKMLYIFRPSEAGEAEGASARFERSNQKCT